MGASVKTPRLVKRGAGLMQLCAGEPIHPARTRASQQIACREGKASGTLDRDVGIWH